MRDKRPPCEEYVSLAFLFAPTSISPPDIHQNMFNCFSDPIVRQNAETRACVQYGYGHTYFLNRRIIPYSDRMRMEHVVVEARYRLLRNFLILIPTDPTITTINWHTSRRQLKDQLPPFNQPRHDFVRNRNCSHIAADSLDVIHGQS